MPVVKPHTYEQRQFPNIYCVNTFVRYDKPFRFVYESISDISIAIHNRYGYNFCLKENFTSDYITNNIHLLNRLSDVQIRELYKYGFGRFNFANTNLIHSECTYAVYKIQAQYPGKQCDSTTYEAYEKCFKVCEPCYKQGSHYSNLKRHFKDDDITKYESEVTFNSLHILEYNFNRIFDIFDKGNQFFNAYELYHSYNSNAYYCNNCQRALLDNLAFTTLDHLLNQCDSCGLYDFFEVQQFRPIKEVHMCDDFPKSEILKNYYETNCAKRRLSFSDTDWLDCNKPKYEVPKLGILAVEALVKDL